MPGRAQLAVVRALEVFLAPDLYVALKALVPFEVDVIRGFTTHRTRLIEVREVPRGALRRGLDLRTPIPFAFLNVEAQRLVIADATAGVSHV
jgi:hypothetical protein